MKEHWRKRLNSIENLEERRLLRDIINTALTPLEDYKDAQLEAIKQRVFDEVKVDDDEFAIYGAVIPRKDYDVNSDFLYPMIDDDLTEIPSDTVESGEKLFLGKVYIERDYLELENIKKDILNRKFRGQLKTNRNSYEIEVSLTPYTGYIKQVEKLYNLFAENNLNWCTVLFPSIYKFMEMHLETQIIFEKDEEIEEIITNLEELESYKQMDQIPLWNVRTTSFGSYGKKSGDNPNHYEHTLQEANSTRKLGYLFEGGSESEGIMGVRRETEKMVLIASTDIISKWHLWTIVSPLNSELNHKNLLSNKKVESFIDHYARRHGQKPVFTLGEIYRLSNMFVDTSDLKLVDIEMNVKYEGFETYELNPFVIDEIRTVKDKRVMKLKFTTENLTPFTRDIMSFLTSGISLHFPDCRCFGVLIENEKAQEKE